MTKLTLFALLFFFVIMIPPIANAGDPIHLGVTNQTLDAFFDLRLDYHQIPKTNIILSEKIAAPNAGDVEKILALDINNITREILVDQFNGKADDGVFTISENSQGDSLEITPWILLQFLEDGQVQPWMVWNVQFKDLFWNKKKWEGCCYICLSQPRPLDGKESWTSNGGEPLKQAAKADALKLLELTRKDLMGVYKKSSFQSARMSALWFGEKENKEIGARFIEPDPETLMINSFDDRELMNFQAGRLTGLLLKKVNSNTVLFYGSLIIPKRVVEIIAEKPKMTPTMDSHNNLRQ